jgi:hypothetical protein
MGKLGDFKDSFLEVLWIMRSTLSTFWFWFPIIYMAYVILQLWMMVYISPLTLAILPVALIIYGVRLEDKRVRARYGLKEKRLPATHALGTSPEPRKQFEWEVEQAVEQYEQLLKEHKDKNGEQSNS